MKNVLCICAKNEIKKSLAAREQLHNCAVYSILKWAFFKKKKQRGKKYKCVMWWSSTDKMMHLPLSLVSSDITFQKLNSVISLFHYKCNPYKSFQLLRSSPPFFNAILMLPKLPRPSSNLGQKTFALPRSKTAKFSPEGKVIKDLYSRLPKYAHRLLKQDMHIRQLIPR